MVRYGIWKKEFSIMATVTLDLQQLLGLRIAGPGQATTSAKIGNKLGIKEGEKTAKDH
jgi:hypothetical protein